MAAVPAVTEPDHWPVFPNILKLMWSVAGGLTMGGEITISVSYEQSSRYRLKNLSNKIN